MRLFQKLQGDGGVFALAIIVITLIRTISYPTTHLLVLPNSSDIVIAKRAVLVQSPTKPRQLYLV